MYFDFGLKALASPQIEFTGEVWKLPKWTNTNLEVLLRAEAGTHPSSLAPANIYQTKKKRIEYHFPVQFTFLGLSVFFQQNNNLSVCNETTDENYVI